MVRETAHFAYDLTDEMIADIDVIVTQSVFALEMMKYGMPIWYLDGKRNIPRTGLS